MSERPSSSVATSTAAPSLRSHAVQATWLTRLEGKGVVLISGDDPLSFHEAQTYRRSSEPLREQLAHLLDVVLYNPAQSVDNEPNISLLRMIRQTCRTFNKLNAALSEENGWTIPVKQLLDHVTQSTPAVEVSVVDRDVSSSLLSIIGHTDLRKVRPDMLIGLSPDTIRIAENAASATLPGSIRQYVNSRSVLVPYEISQVLSAEHWFSYMFLELKGPNGNSGEARIQNFTACFVGLQILRTLAQLARDADTNSFREPTECMRRTYGLQTEGSGQVWRLVTMKATDDFYDLDSGDDPEGTYSVTNLWTGDVTDPYMLVQLIAIIHSIAAEAAERSEIIGNWLFCLRDLDKPATPRKRVSVSAGAKMPSTTPKKRARPEEAPGVNENRSTVNDAATPIGGSSDRESANRFSSTVKTMSRQSRTRDFELGLAAFDSSSQLYKNELDAWLSNIASGSGSANATHHNCKLDADMTYGTEDERDERNQPWVKIGAIARSHSMSLAMH